MTTPKPPGPAGTPPPDLSGLPPDVAARVRQAQAKVDEAATAARKAVDDGDVVAAVDAIKRGAAAMDDVMRAQVEDLADMIALDDRPVPHEVLDAVATRAALRMPPRYDRFRLVVVLDNNTCRACRDADGLMYQCPAGDTPPPVTHCTHRPEVDGRACRCAWEPVAAFIPPAICDARLPTNPDVVCSRPAGHFGPHGAPLPGDSFESRSPRHVVHWGTIQTACGIIGVADTPGTMVVREVTCRNCLASATMRPPRRAPEAGAPPEVPFVASRPELGEGQLTGPRAMAKVNATPLFEAFPPPAGFVDPFDIPCPTHKVGRSHPCGFLDGDAVVCCYRVIAARAR